jgi:hypothetical protein
MTDGWLLPQLVQHGAALLGTAVVLNALVTFVGSFAFALLAARVVGSPRLAKFILLTPWLRVVYDVLRGATPNAYVLSEHAGTKGSLGAFQLGVGGAPPLVPLVQAHLDMHGGDHRYGYSVGDMLAHGLFRYVGPTPMLLVLGALLAVSLALLALRARHLLLWQGRLGRAQASAAAVQVIPTSLQRSAVVTRALDTLGPFTSGLLRPRIWLPMGLGDRERAAVLEHELAHVHDCDVLWFGIVGVLTDLFWFVPGARALERRLHERAEEAADARALRRGIAPKVLAESILSQVSPALPGAPPARMVGTAARLQRRLLALAERPRRSRWQLALRLFAALCLTLSVFRSAFGGYS